MILYCYFIARAAPEIENISYRTLHSAPVVFVRHESLVAAVRLLPAGTRSTPELMLEHTAVLAAALKHATVLPLRFGTSFRAEAALLAILDKRGPELLEALDRLDGKAEMGLRVTVPDDASAEARAAQIAEICRPLDYWMEARPFTAGAAVLDLAHLIYRRDAEEYRQKVKPHAIEVAGPRPPFHFLPQFLRRPVRSERRPPRARAASA